MNPLKFSFIILFLTFLLIANQAQDTTYISSQIITSDIIWTKAKSPYKLSGMIEVDKDVTLTIEPGVEIIFDFDASLYVYGGNLIAKGNSQDSIQFIGHGYNGSPNWQIEIGNGHSGQSELEYCRLIDINNFYIGWGRDGETHVDVKHSTFEYSGNIDIYSGVTLYGGDSICYNTFNKEVKIHQDQTICIRNNNFLGQVGIAETNTERDLRFNYWGPLGTSEMNMGSNPKDISVIYDYFDDPNVGLANYSHWLDAPWPEGQPVGDSYTAILKLYNDSYQENKLTYQPGESAYIEVIDPDQNTNTSANDQLEISICSDTEHEGEVITLNETGLNTGIFRSSVALDYSTGSAIPDGSLQVIKGDWISLDYTDDADDWGNPMNISVEALFGGTISPAQTITTPFVFTQANSPYLVTGEHYIDGGSVTIEPGVTIYVNGPDFINSTNGGFFAVGNQQDSIRILFKKLINNSSGILLMNSGKLEYCIIENCPIINLQHGMIVRNCLIKNSLPNWGLLPNGTCIIENNHFINSEVSLGNRNTSIIQYNDFTNCQVAISIQDICGSVIRYNTIEHGETGIRIASKFENPEGIKFNTIRYNYQGINIEYGSTMQPIVIQYNNIYENSNYDLINSNSYTNARFNYWGEDPTNEMASGNNPKNLPNIYDSYDNPDLAFVNYSSWLDATWPDGNPAESGDPAKLFLSDLNESESEYVITETQAQINLYDADLNTLSDQIERIAVSVWSDLEPEAEKIWLEEAGMDTSLFTSLINFDQNSGYPINDGNIQVDLLNKVRLSYTDSLNEWNKIKHLLVEYQFKTKPVLRPEKTENTIMLLHFDEGSGQVTLDESDQANHGVFGITTEVETRDPLWDPHGISGSCLYFPDNRQGRLRTQYGNLALDTITTNVTIEFWTKMVNVMDRQDFFVKYGGCEGVQDNRWCMFYTSDNKFNGYFRMQNVQAGRDSHDLWSNADFAYNRWMHLAMTYNGSEISFYQNGVKVGTEVHSNKIDVSEPKHEICIGDGWGEMYIDEFHILNIAKEQFNLYPSISPGKINYFEISDSGFNSVILEWFSPGADNYTGICDLYDLRMSTSPIDSASFYEADSVTGLPAPLTAGSLQQFTVEGLNSGTTYYFALKAKNEEGEWSPISNIAFCNTLVRYMTDERDGQQYKIQQIGYQTWLAENLNYYTPEGSWYYNGDSVTWADTLGRLYDWATALGIPERYNTSDTIVPYQTRGVCPAGWHLPTDADWRVLEKEMGMDSSQIVNFGWRGTIQGGLLKYDSLSGFDALPGGYRTQDGIFTMIDTSYHFWTATEYDANNALYRGMDTSRSDIYRGEFLKTSGLSVRCVKDIEPLQISLAKSDVTKVNGSDGNIQANISGGILPYSYSWSDGSKNKDLSEIPQGKYIIQVTDARDSTAIDSVVVYETFTDKRDNQVYKVVHIGNRVWMAENLNFRTTNGSYYYDNDSLANADQYGRLYNFQTASQVCPTDWYLPFDREWQQLELDLGMATVDTGNTGFRGNDQGDQLKTGGTSGFDALYAGSYDLADFSGLGTDGYFWTATDTGTKAFYRHVQDGESTIDRDSSLQANAYSVRCIVDTCALIDIAFEREHVSCFGLSDGSIHLTVSGGKEPYSFLWSTEDTTDYITSLPAGEYTLYLSDNVGCVRYDTITITQPSPLTSAITDSSNITCNGFNDGWAAVTVAGGTLPYRYSWDNPAGTKDSLATNLRAYQYYYITVIDSNDCTIRDSVLLTEPDALDLGLQSQYQLCQGQTVEIIANEGFTEYNWSNGETSTNQITLSEPGNYSLTVMDDNGCPGYAEFNVYLDFVYQGEEICIVTVDENGKNKIVWEKTEGYDIQEYNIYREGEMFNQYDLIGTVPFDQYSEFVDTGSYPEQLPYRYKLSVVNSCGSKSEKSFYHQTIHLQIGPAISGWNLNWTQYEYEAGGISFLRYDIYRGPSKDNLELIKSVSSSFTSYTDNTAPDGLLYYQVAGLMANPCDPTGNIKSTNELIEYAYSNYGDNGQETILNKDYDNNDLMIYPNPSADKIFISFNNQEMESYRLFITDLTGKQVYTIDPVLGSIIEVDCSYLQPGYYLVELRGKKTLRGTFIKE